MASTKNELWEHCKSIADDVTEAYERGELFDYLNEYILDVEFVVSPPRSLRSVCLARTLGGPSIYIDTREHGVVGYWGGERAYTGLDYDLCNEIERAFAEMYDYEY